MSNFAATQTYNALAARPADVDDLPGVIFAGAQDGEVSGVAIVAQGYVAQCATAVATLIAADTATCSLSGFTVAGLNLAAGESRTIRARYRTSGAAATAVTHGYTDFGVINVAGTLTATTLNTIVYGATGMVANTVSWSIVSSAPQLVVTLGAGVTACRVVVDFFLDPKGS